MFHCQYSLGAEFDLGADRVELEGYSLWRRKGPFKEIRLPIVFWIALSFESVLSLQRQPAYDESDYPAQAMG